MYSQATTVTPMTATLYVAAGGGGDAIAAAILATHAAPGEQVHIATYAWDRLIIDPLPGPRTASDFTYLAEHAAYVWEITAKTAPRPPAGSTLPRLASELDARLFLLDPQAGAVGMAQQLTSIARFLRVTKLVLVDVGGDLVAVGTEPELRSPLADSLALAACALAGLPFDVLVAGPGVDGELSEQQVVERCPVLSGVSVPPLRADDVTPFSALFEWHPSEATGLWIAATQGYRGRIEIRDAGIPLALTDVTPQVFAIPAGELLKTNVFTDALMTTRTLAEVEAVITEVRGSTELDYERRKADLRGRAENVRVDRSELVDRIECVSADAGSRVDYLTVRRLAELIDFPSGDFPRLVELLRTVDERRLAAPLWTVR